MIEDFIQPEELSVDDGLKLIKYVPCDEVSLGWYQDPIVCKQVDNIDFPYDLNRLHRMYDYLTSQGECYLIQYTEEGSTQFIGDISLCYGEISIVIEKKYQNRHFGRKCVGALLTRAKELGFSSVSCEIYDFNLQSKAMFTSCGFVPCGKDHYRHTF